MGLHHSRPIRIPFVRICAGRTVLADWLGVCDSPEYAQWSRELLATPSAGSDTWHRAQVLNCPDSAFCRENTFRNELVSLCGCHVRSAREASQCDWGRREGGSLRDTPSVIMLDRGSCQIISALPQIDTAQLIRVWIMRPFVDGARAEWRCVGFWSWGTSVSRARPRSRCDRIR